MKQEMLLNFETNYGSFMGILPVKKIVRDAALSITVTCTDDTTMRFWNESEVDEDNIQGIGEEIDEFTQICREVFSDLAIKGKAWLEVDYCSLNGEDAGFLK